ncbi:MAG TPA: cytochrome c [Roseiarcus sp.]|jgi:mono/diheme cytochrome c family protein
MKRSTAIAGTAATAFVALGGAAMAFIWKPEIAPIDPSRLARFDPELVRKGANLAALGDCNTCHTAPDGQPFAGGLPLPTPVGVVYSTNITPDPDTGIGRWSEDAFRRAMREGVDRKGRYLYPAFPYDHFTLVSDADDEALYAFLMTRQPAHAAAPVNRLPFPLNQRPVLAGWNLLFLRRGPFKPDPAHDDLWNRGAYLVEGVGHCGACHTPRNLFGAEKRGEAFAGGEAEGWRAFPINASSPASVPWDADALYGYLRRGWHGLHGVARGPMAPVADNLASVPDSDVRAIAVYVASLMGEPAPERRRQGERLAADAEPFGSGGKPQSAGSQAAPPPQAAGGAGAAIYASACASCHESGRPAPYGGVNLALSTAINGETPRNLLNILLAGLPAADAVRAPIMPGFGAILTDTQIAALTSYLRSRFSAKPAWSDLPAQIREARDGEVAANPSSDARQTAATSH